MRILVNINHKTTGLDRVVLSDDTQTSARSVQQDTIESAWENLSEFTAISAGNGCVCDTQTIQVELQGPKTLLFQVISKDAASIFHHLGNVSGFTSWG
jgi:hypothetical protein